VKPRLTPKQSFLLYALVLGIVFVFYFFGLVIGRSQFSLGPAQARVTPPPMARPEPVRDVKPDLDFYQRIMAPSGSDSQRTAKPAPTVEIRDSDQEAAPTLEPPPASSPTEGVPAASPREEPPVAALPVDLPLRAGQETAPDVYTVQVAALVSVSDARGVLTRVQARGFSGVVQPPLTKEDKFHRVWVGEFDTMEEARQMESRLKASGFQTYVRKTAAAR
jgi:cell division septation protein DedD